MRVDDEVTVTVGDPLDSMTGGAQDPALALLNSGRCGVSFPDEARTRATVRLHRLQSLDCLPSLLPARTQAGHSSMPSLQHPKL
jgi:hypothetical protein